MQSCLDYPDAEWASEDSSDEKLYCSLMKKLDSKGKLVDVDFCKSPLSTLKQRVYHVGGSTVRLSGTINSSLNHYNVDVRLAIYSSSQRSAKKLLEELRYIKSNNNR